MAQIPTQENSPPFLYFYAEERGVFQEVQYTEGCFERERSVNPGSDGTAR